MKLKKTVPYKIRRALSMAAIIGAPILPIAASCNKIEPEQHDVEIVFDMGTVDKKLDMKTLQELIQDKTVRYIYMTASDHWNGFIARNISESRANFWQPRIDMSPKMRGRGDFDFKLGEASKVPEDSLWFVKNGWTINKQHQK